MSLKKEEKREEQMEEEEQERVKKNKLEEGEERKKRKGTNVLTIWSGSGKCNKLPGVWHRSWPPVMYSEELAT